MILRSISSKRRSSSTRRLSTMSKLPEKSSQKKPRVIHWYRTDLRVHDSPSLKTAIDLDPECLWSIWIWDPTYVQGHRVGMNRLHFVLESMRELSGSLTSIDSGHKLSVLRGSPEKVLDWIFKNWDVTHIVWEIDTSAYARNRDAAIMDLAQKHNVTALPVLGHTLYSVPLLLKHNANKPTTTMQQWMKAASHLPSPEFPIPAPTELPPAGKVILPEGGFIHDDGTEPKDVNLQEQGGWRRERVSCFDKEGRTATDIPSLESVGIVKEEVQSLIPPGERVALDRLARLCKDKAWVAAFAKPQSSPAVVPSEFMEGAMYKNPSQKGEIKNTKAAGGSTFVLSMFLKFGCLSVRTFYHSAKQAIEDYKAANLTGAVVQSEPENIIGQLKFREMYICAEYATPNFSRIRGNKLCRYISWKCPTRYDENGVEIHPRPKDDEDAEKILYAWTHGQTGFPWIDALMRQLRQTGWMHHLGRHSVACFLTRGQGYISWERGAEVFDELLLDWDPAANSGNWMWLSCSAFYSMYYRVYSPVSFPQKWDPTGQLVRLYCPELKDFPDKYIYEPHKAPLSIQQKANCVIGVTYPHPILDLKTSQASCQRLMKQAYDANLYGTSPAVLDGSAQDLLDIRAKAGKTAADGDGGSTFKEESGVKSDKAKGAPKRMNPFERAKMGSTASTVKTNDPAVKRKKLS